MTVARKVDISTHVIGLDRNLAAKRLPALDDPGMPVDGLTFGVARMSGNAPHGGERHPDGDEVLYLIAGHARVIFPDDAEPEIDLLPGEVLIVPKGVWHRVEIIEPCHFVYLTPGLNNEVRPITVET